MQLSRRQLMLASLGLAASAGVSAASVAGSPALARKIASTGEQVPALGMGTWLTFNIEPRDPAFAQRQEVLREFFAAGGRLIDSSPIYGLAQKAVGAGLQQLGQDDFFSASKIWTPMAMSDAALGRRQFDEMQGLWREKPFDLVMVHNLVDHAIHLPMLRELRQEGAIRYLGVSTSHGRRHADLEALMRSQPLDFIQLSYNIANRQAEQRLLPLAAEQGMGVIINRPFQTGRLFQLVKNQPLPPLASQLECTAWSQLFLKFILAHPAVTCAIPATRNPAHMRENMEALHGPLADLGQRQELVEYFEKVAA